MKTLWFVEGLNVDDMRKLAEKVADLASQLKDSNTENKKKDKEIAKLKEKLEQEKKEKEFLTMKQATVLWVIY